METPKQAPLHLVMFGRPGSGKSSLAERLGAEWGYKLIRTGELLRETVRSGDTLGHRVEALLSRGELASDEIISELLAKNLESPKTTRLLFDGFPRTLGQIPMLETLERTLDFKIDCFLDVTVTRDAAVARMTGRRVCPSCGATYHLIAKPPIVSETCDRDGTTLERRRDDAMAVVTVRQRLYDEQTHPVFLHYRQVRPGLCCSVNGDQGVDAVYRETCASLGLTPPVFD